MLEPEENREQGISVITVIILFNIILSVSLAS